MTTSPLDCDIAGNCAHPGKSKGRQGAQPLQRVSARCSAYTSVVVFERPVVTEAAAAIRGSAVPAAAAGSRHHGECAQATGMARSNSRNVRVGRGEAGSRHVRGRTGSPGTLRQRRRGDASSSEYRQGGNFTLLDHGTSSPNGRSRQSTTL